jgi:hypothetical protein
MIHWFTRRSSRHSSQAAIRQVRPRLELLERRDCPSSSSGATAPVITSFAVNAETGVTVEVTGDVQDANPASCVINLTGTIQGSVQVNGDGSFSAEVTANSVGMVTAVAQDTVTTLSSAPANANVAPQPPEIENFAFVHIAQNVWTFSGTVIDLVPANVPVTFGGPGNLQGATTNADANGNFSLTITLQNMPPSFIVTAIATDNFGLQSDQVGLLAS